MSKVHGIEQWHDVVGFEGLYEVSSLGRVKSLARTIQKGNYSYDYGEKFLKPFKGTKYGHLQVELGKGNKRWVHRLVLEAFVGPCPDGAEGCHLDGVPVNNFLSNLAWQTPKENSDDRKKHGRDKDGPKGETHPFAKLNDDLVRQIREEYAEGDTTLKKLSEKYKVHVVTLSDLIRRKTWKHTI